MASLQNEQIDQSYQGLIKTADNTSTPPFPPVALQYGDGTDLPIKIGDGTSVGAGDIVTIQSGNRIFDINANGLALIGPSYIDGLAGTIPIVNGTYTFGQGFPGAPATNVDFTNATVTGLPDNDTTYDLGSAQSTNDVDLTLTGSDATTDTVKLVAGTNITLTDNGSNQVTIDASGGAAGLENGTGTDSLQSAAALTTTPATSTGARSIALGNAGDAQADETIAIGDGATATSGLNIAIGDNANASGANNFARGNIAIGPNTTASDERCVAIGKDTTASGARGIAIGESAFASGASSISIGHSSDAQNGQAIALGFNAQALSAQGIAVGVNAATGTSGEAAAFGLDATATGNAGALALGRNATASGTVSTALGRNSTASGNYDVAIGYNVTAVWDFGTTVNQLAIANYANLNYADDSAAATGGVPLGGVYHTSGALKVRTT